MRVLHTDCSKRRRHARSVYLSIRETEGFGHLAESNPIMHSLLSVFEEPWPCARETLRECLKHTQAFISYELLWNIPDSRAQEIPGGIPRNLEGSLSANTWRGTCSTWGFELLLSIRPAGIQRDRIDLHAGERYVSYARLPSISVCKNSD